MTKKIIKNKDDTYNVGKENVSRAKAVAEAEKNPDYHNMKRNRVRYPRANPDGNKNNNVNPKN